MSPYVKKRKVSIVKSHNGKSPNSNTGTLCLKLPTGEEKI
jgi:hypothetical protein